MKKVRITAGSVSLSAELNETETALAIYDSLPIKGIANVWGDEIYFNIDLRLELESSAKEEVEIGDLGYWPMGPAFCIFFGKTPVSTSDKPRAYSPVNVFGGIIGDAREFCSVEDGEEVTIEKE